MDGRKGAERNSNDINLAQCYERQEVVESIDHSRPKGTKKENTSTDVITIATKAVLFNNTFQCLYYKCYYGTPATGDTILGAYIQGKLNPNYEQKS